MNEPNEWSLRAAKQIVETMTQRMHLSDTEIAQIIEREAPDFDKFGDYRNTARKAISKHEGGEENE